MKNIAVRIRTFFVIIDCFLDVNNLHNSKFFSNFAAAKVRRKIDLCKFNSYYATQNRGL
mgnify:CR=1 FL=1